MVNYFRRCLPLVRGRWPCTTMRPTACPGWWWGGWAGRRRGSTPAAPPASPPGTSSYTSSSTNRNTMESLLCNFRREKLRRHNISLGKEPFFFLCENTWVVFTNRSSSIYKNGKYILNILFKIQATYFEMYEINVLFLTFLSTMPLKSFLYQVNIIHKT